MLDKKLWGLTLRQHLAIGFFLLLIHLASKGLQFWIYSIVSDHAPDLSGVWLTLLWSLALYVGMILSVKQRKGVAPRVVVTTPEEVVRTRNKGFWGFLFGPARPAEKKLLGLTWRQRWQSAFCSFMGTMCAWGIVYWLAAVFTGHAPHADAIIIIWAPPVFALLGFSGLNYYFRHWLKSII